MATNNETIRKNMNVYFGHENWNLVLNMMIGIRTAIKSLYSFENRELLPNDF